MAETFLRRWFGKAPAPGADDARAEIDRLLPDRPTTRGPLLWLRAILDDLVPVAKDVGSVLPDREMARGRLLAGVPLLRGSTIPIDTAAFYCRWKRATAALAEHQPEVVRGRPEPDALIAAVVSGEPLEPLAAAVGCPSDLFVTLARFVLFPELVPFASAADPLRQGIPWEHGECPVCGGAALLAEFRGLDQSRFLRCGWCAASWEVSRQWCPACATRDHDALGFLSKEGEENRYRVATCDACRTGIKALSVLSALPPLMLLVADAATLHLDLAAADRGYATTKVASGPDAAVLDSGTHGLACGKAPLAGEEA